MSQSERNIIMLKKIIRGFITTAIMASVFTLTAFAATTTQVTKRVEATHNGTTGSSYSSLTAVNTTLHDGTYFHWTASVENKPTSIKSTTTQVEWKIYKNAQLFSTVGSKSNFQVGNTTSTGTVKTMLGSGKKTYSTMNNMYRVYLNVVLCPPAYANYATFNFGGVFYGYKN